MERTKINGRFAYLPWYEMDSIATAWAHKHFGSNNAKVQFSGEMLMLMPNESFVQVFSKSNNQLWHELYEKYDSEHNYEFDHALYDIMVIRALSNELKSACGFKPKSFVATEYGIFLFDTALPSDKFCSEEN